MSFGKGVNVFLRINDQNCHQLLSLLNVFAPLIDQIIIFDKIDMNMIEFRELQNSSHLGI